MRWRAAAMLSILLVAGAATADRLEPAEPRAPMPDVVGTRAGVLTCPIATIARGRAYLHIANVGSEDSTLRITLFPRKGKRVVIAEKLAAEDVRTLALHDRIAGESSALVEYSGGVVVVSHSLWIAPEKGKPSGGAAGACQPSFSTTVALAPLRTLGTDTKLTLFNPGAADAVVSVVLLTRDRRAVPERLTRRIVPAHGRRDFAIGAFAFEESDVIAMVDASSGRVVPEALVTSKTRGIELVGAQAPGDEMVVAFGEGGTGAVRTYAAVGDLDTGISLTQLGTEGPIGDPSTRTLTPVELIRGSGPSSAVPGAFVLRRTAGAPVAGGAYWTYKRGREVDLGSMEALEPFTRWAAALASVAERTSTWALITNPSREPATVSMKVKGPKGVASSELTVPPGSVMRTTVSTAKGSMWVEITSDIPVTLALTQATRAYRSSNALQYFDLPAIPLRPPLPVAARSDQRTGISAPT